jgi:hypothetical protein
MLARRFLRHFLPNLVPVANDRPSWYRFAVFSRMEFAEPRSYADPEKAACRIVEIASTVEPVQEGRVFIKLVNGPFLFKDKGSPAEYERLKLELERGLARDAWERHLRAVHSGRCRAVRLAFTPTNFWLHQQVALRKEQDSRPAVGRRAMNFLPAS